MSQLYNFLKIQSVLFQAALVDVICINRYRGWYQDTGHAETIQSYMTYDLAQWHNTFKKPIIVSEYGADTISGLHTVSLHRVILLSSCTTYNTAITIVSSDNEN